MKIIIIIILLNIYKPTHCLPIYKKDLRSMHQKEKNRIILEIINNDFNEISRNIINTAMKGAYEYKFNIRCMYKLLINGMCIEDLSQVHISFNRFNSNIITSNKIILKLYTHKLLERLNYTFPDSNITQIKKPCCNYIISWGSSNDAHRADTEDFY
jgi:hypothetical protein